MPGFEGRGATKELKSYMLRTVADAALYCLLQYSTFTHLRRMLRDMHAILILPGSAT